MRQGQGTGRAMLWAIWLLCALVWLPAGGASAQGLPLQQFLSITEPSAPEQSAPRQSRPQQSRPANRQGFAEPSVEDYGRLAAAEPAEPLVMGFGLDAASNYLGVFKGRLKAIIERVPDAIDELNTTLKAASPTGKPVHFVGIAVFAALLLVLGNAVTGIFLVFVARPMFVRMQKPNPIGYSDKLPVLATRVLFAAFSAALTISVAAGAGLFFYDGHAPTLLTVIAVLGTYGAFTVVHTVWRMALAPFLPHYRIPNIGDRDARLLYRWVSIGSFSGIAGYAFCYWIVGLGLPREVHVIMTFAVTLVTIVILLAALRANRRAITGVLIGDRRGRPMTWMQRVVAATWAPFAGIYILVSWVDLLVRLVLGVPAGPERIMVPFFLIVAAMAMFAITMFVVERIFARQRRIRAMNAAARAAEASAEAKAREQAIFSGAHFADAGDMDGDGEDEGGARVVSRPAADPAAAVPAAAGAPDAATAEAAAQAEAQAEVEAMRPGTGMRTFEDLARRVSSLLAIGVGGWVLIWYWGGSEIFAESAFFGVVEDVVDVLFVGYIVYHATRIWLDQKIAEEGGDEDPTETMLEGEGGGAGATRRATLLPLVRNFILVVIGVTVALVIALELGVNVAPLFAGAGVVGLAIGFGAQTLVRDIISGAFFLLDDAFRKGEYIDVGSVKGTVEKISLRSFQLRHHLGMLHTIPFGEVQFLTNFSRDWVMMKLPLRLTYDTDVEKVRKLVKKLGLHLMEDPVIGHLFLQPLKSQGVIEMEDSAMIVRVKFMTKPGDQWVVRKRVYAEIRELFNAEGIKFAHREVTVRIPDLPTDRPMTEQERSAVGAATRANLDVIEAEAMRGTGTHGPADDR